jgi:subtilase family serine protease
MNQTKRPGPNASLIALALIVSMAILSSAANRSGNPEAGQASRRPHSSMRLPSMSGPVGRNGRVPDLVYSSTFLGPLAQDEVLSLSIAFRIEDPDGLSRTIDNLYDPGSPDFHHWLTPQEFSQGFGRSEDELRKAQDWIAGQGFQIDQIWPNNLAITFTGTAESAERAFQVTIGEYVDPSGRVFFSNQQEPVLPAGMAEITEDLVGLDNAYPYHVSSGRGPTLVEHGPATGHLPASQLAIAPAAEFRNGTHFLSPAEIRRAYDVTPLTDLDIRGQGQRVAIIIDSDLPQTDIDLFRSQFNLPEANVKRFTAPGSQNPGINDDAVETAIDVDQVSVVAPLAEIDLILVPGLSPESVLVGQEFVVNTLLPGSVNESFGRCESNSHRQVVQDLMLQAVAGGIAFFAISGDDGAECFTPGPSESGMREIECPACYDGVTAVGGTAFSQATFDSKGGMLSIDAETVWNHPPGVRFGCEGGKQLPQHKGLGASGGGMSTIVPKPDYQVVATGFAGGVPEGTFRFIPDVAALASGDEPSTTAVFGGDLVPVYGTSKASPLWAGLMALINQAKGSVQGSPNFELYRLGIQQFRDNGPLVFIDIAQGNNSTGPRKPCVPVGVTGFFAGFGYDPVTGWGSPDFAQLVAAYNVPGATGTGPVINSVVARLDGDVLAVTGAATDTAAAMNSVRLTLQDSSNATVFQSTIPIVVRPAASASYSFQLGGMTKFPTAVRASLVIMDRLGNQSAPVQADFSNSDPGGPILNSVFFDGRRLTIQGVALSGKLTLEVNGIAVGLRNVESNTQAVFRGSLAKLNLMPGVNRIRLERASLFSNILLLTL